MPVLGDALALYSGAEPVESVYAGSQKVWPTGPPLNQQTGMAPGFHYLTMDDEPFFQLMDDLVDLGVDWLRCDVPWAPMEPTEGTINWTPVDRYVNASVERGIKVIGCVHFTPPWARTGDSDRVPPDDPADYADFCVKVALRYPGMVLELWNEPNHGPFWETPSAEDYADLIKVAYPAIKSASPSTLVLSGGIGWAPDGPNPHTFLADIYTAGGGDSFDAVAAHPYSWPQSPSSPGSAWQAMSLMRDVMELNGDGGKKIWVTEFGTPTGTAGELTITEQDQADVLTEAYGLWRTYDWAGLMCWYSHLDLGTTPGEETFGIIRNTGVKKAAWAALEALG